MLLDFVPQKKTFFKQTTREMCELLTKPTQPLYRQQPQIINAKGLQLCKCREQDKERTNVIDVIVAVVESSHSLSAARRTNKKHGNLINKPVSVTRLNQSTNRTQTCKLCTDGIRGMTRLLNNMHGSRNMHVESSCPYA